MKYYFPYLLILLALLVGTFAKADDALTWKPEVFAQQDQVVDHTPEAASSSEEGPNEILSTIKTIGIGILLVMVLGMVAVYRQMLRRKKRN